MDIRENKIVLLSLCLLLFLSAQLAHSQVLYSGGESVDKLSVQVDKSGGADEELGVEIVAGQKAVAIDEKGCERAAERGDTIAEKEAIEQPKSEAENELFSESRELGEEQSLEVIELSDTITTSTDNVSLEEADTAEVKRKGLFARIDDYFRRSNVDQTFDKKIDISVIGGPHYSSDLKFGLGLVAAGLYRLDRRDSITPPSNISLVGNVSTTGFWMLGAEGHNIFRHSNHRIDYSAMFVSNPTKLWGIGYDMGNNGANEVDYRKLSTQIKFDYMFRLVSDLYLGTTLNLSYVEGKKFESKYIDSELLENQAHYCFSSGLGLFLMYDSRDVITAPHRGWYFRLENTLFPKMFGNTMHFNRLELTLNFYHKVWKDAVLAYDLHGIYNTGEVPWTQLAMLGNSQRMRGYYNGRYRDENILEVQVELRQKIWRRIGITTWMGAGNVFPTFGDFEFSHTLPNFGVGLRWEFKNRVNIRLDFGMGRKGQRGFIFNINEAF